MHAWGPSSSSYKSTKQDGSVVLLTDNTSPIFELILSSRQTEDETHSCSNHVGSLVIGLAPCVRHKLYGSKRSRVHGRGTPSPNGPFGDGVPQVLKVTILDFPKAPWRV